MTFNSRYLLKVLFAVAIFLLISELILEKLLPGANKDALAVSHEEADSVFLKTINDFGIEPQWLSKKGEKYTARIPADVPSELILLDLSESFKKKKITISSKEVIKGSTTFMELTSGEDKILSVEFIYDKQKKRNISTLSFILLNTQRLGEKETAELLNLTDNYTIALIPSKKNRALAALLSEKGKEYALLINRNINELEYKLDDKFSDRKLIITFQTITSHFPKAGYYILDDITENYSERVNDLVQRELNKRKMKYKPLNDFKQIEDISSPEKFQDLIDVRGDQVFTINASDFLKYRDEFKSLRKRGIKVANLSAVVL
jgi:hypothetical protein